MDLFKCCQDFLQSIYGEKYCRRVCSEIEMSSILTLLWISFDAAGVQHDFRGQEELYQYLRETFKIKTRDKLRTEAPDSCDNSESYEPIPPVALADALQKEVEKEVEKDVEKDVEKVEEVEKDVEKEVREEREFLSIDLIVSPFVSKKKIYSPDVDDDKDCQEYADGIPPRIMELLAIPQPEQKSQAWLNQRQDYITASSFGASTGLLGPAAVVKLLLDKISRGKLNPFSGNQATQWGKSTSQYPMTYIVIE